MARNIKITITIISGIISFLYFYIPVLCIDFIDCDWIYYTDNLFIISGGIFYGISWFEPESSLPYIVQFILFLIGWFFLYFIIKVIYLYFYAIIKKRDKSE